MNLPTTTNRAAAAEPQSVVPPAPVPYLPEPEIAEILMRGCCIAAGVKQPAFPLDRRAVLELVKSLGYLCSERALDRLVSLRLIASPPPDGPGRKGLWTRQHAMSLINSLESRRRWLPDHPAHAAKITPWERYAADPQFTDEADHLDLGLLLDSLASPDLDWKEREPLVIALRYRLRKEGLLDE